MDTLFGDRIRLQEFLDASKTQDERNKLGQFATPPTLATEIIHATQKYIDPHSRLRFLDPAFGTGAFFAALRQIFNDDAIESVQGIEVDPHYAEPTQQLWRSTRLKLKFGDFTELKAPDDEDAKPNLIVCNPPYVRHHHLDPQQKEQLKEKVRLRTGIQLNGLAGFYCYFLLLSHTWMAQNGIGCWLIPGEFLDVNYGQKVKQYLLKKVSLLRIHRFDPEETQFEDALVSSVVVWFRNALPDPDGEIEFTFGGTFDQPKTTKIISHKHVNSRSKWSKLISRTHSKAIGLDSPIIKISDLFQIKRGIATGANKFFILTPDQIRDNELSFDFFTPILPSPRFLESDQIMGDENGFPCHAKRLFLLNCQLPEVEVRKNHPALWKYLETGKAQQIHERYLCRHRSPWYAQEFRPAAPILCTYMGRNQNPFKFILNHSQATAPNVYLMLYPKQNLQRHLEDNPELIVKIWQALKALNSADLIGEGRVYGGGLYKLEPKELGNASLPAAEKILPEIVSGLATQLSLF